LSPPPSNLTGRFFAHRVKLLLSPGRRVPPCGQVSHIPPFWVLFFPSSRYVWLETLFNQRAEFPGAKFDRLLFIQPPSLAFSFAEKKSSSRRNPPSLVVKNSHASSFVEVVGLQSLYVSPRNGIFCRALPLKFFLNSFLARFSGPFLIRPGRLFGELPFLGAQPPPPPTLPCEALLEMVTIAERLPSSCWVGFTPPMGIALNNFHFFSWWRGRTLPPGPPFFILKYFHGPSLHQFYLIPHGMSLSCPTTLVNLSFLCWPVVFLNTMFFFSPLASAGLPTAF